MINQDDIIECLIENCGAVKPDLDIKCVVSDDDESIFYYIEADFYLNIEIWECLNDLEGVLHSYSGEDLSKWVLECKWEKPIVIEDIKLKTPTFQILMLLRMKSVNLIGKF